MSLPEWLEDLPKESTVSIANFTPRLIQALTLAWEALIYYREAGDDSATADEAMRAIEELGE